MNKLIVTSENPIGIIDLENAMLIDPHGELAEAALEQLPPRTTAYLNPALIPFGFNPLEHGEPDRICDAFDALFTGGASTLTREVASFVFETYLREHPRNLPAMLDLVRANDITPVNDKGFDSARVLIESRLGKLLMQPLLRNIFFQHTTFSFDRTIVLDLSGIGRRAAQLLGGLFIACAKGHVIVNDAGFFNYPFPLQDDRFTVICRTLPETFRDELLTIEQKVVYKCSPKDAEDLRTYVGKLNPGELIDPTETPWWIGYRPEPTHTSEEHIRRSRASFSFL